MAEPQLLTPAPGCRIVTDDSEIVLFAQPPEVLKGLLRENITHFDTLVLTDIREKDGALLNNLLGIAKQQYSHNFVVARHTSYDERCLLVVMCFHIYIYIGML